MCYGLEMASLKTRVGILAVMLATSFCSLLGAANTPPHRSVYKPALVLQWKNRLHAANVELQQSNWRKGCDIADSVLREMRDAIASGEASGDLLAVALLFRAIGESGLGQMEHAFWDFGTAQTFYSAYERLDLEPYGEAGARLEPGKYRNGAPVAPNAIDRAASPDLHVTPPHRMSGEPPEYPMAKAASCAVQPPIVVWAVIQRDGHPAMPRMEAGTDPVLALAAFDALREWRFEPARLDGEPVDVFLSLTVNFRVRQCY